MHINIVTQTSTRQCVLPVTEEVVRELHRSGVPCAIVRPAVVGAVAYDPCPGYFGNTTAGMTAVILGYATGVVQI